MSNYSHCTLSICDIYLFPVFGLNSGICLLIAAVPVHCFSITFMYAEIFEKMLSGGLEVSFIM